MSALLPTFTRRRVQAGEVALHVAVAGDGPPVVLLHGFPRTHAAWHAVAPHLARYHLFLLAQMANAIQTLNAMHVFIRPHCPWQNGKVERYNRTLQTEWAYRQVFTTNTACTHALAPWLRFYNTGRRHSALGGQPPTSRLS